MKVRIRLTWSQARVWRAITWAMYLMAAAALAMLLLATATHNPPAGVLP